MTTLHPDLEALMPDGYRARNFDDLEVVYTTTQMREAILAATERAAKKAFINALDDAYNAMFALRGDKVTRFDAQTAIQKIRDAAAIGGASGQEGGGGT